MILGKVTFGPTGPVSINPPTLQSMEALKRQIDNLTAENTRLKQSEANLKRLVSRLTDIAQRHTCNIGQAPDECPACVEADDAIRDGLEVGK